MYVDLGKLSMPKKQKLKRNMSYMDIINFSRKLEAVPVVAFVLDVYLVALKQLEDFIKLLWPFQKI